MSTERADESTVLLDSAIRRTEEFMASMPKATRKKYGYETDANVLPLLKENLQDAAGRSGVPVSFEIRDDNYIVSQREEYNETLLSDKVALISTTPGNGGFAARTEFSAPYADVVTGKDDYVFLATNEDDSPERGSVYGPEECEWLSGS